MNDAPLNLRSAKRSVRDVPGLELLSDWEWYGAEARWALRCRLNIEAPENSLVPRSTEWFVAASADYPWGSLKLYPAKELGITVTFQHQNYNYLSEDKPWRMGDPCLHTPLHVLGRHGFDGEPYGATGPTSRLRWNILRALDWLRAASRNQLVAPGDPFEIPHFYSIALSEQTVAFVEDTGTFEMWTGIEQSFGVLELKVLDSNPAIMVVRSFQDQRGKQELLTLSWGPGLYDGHRAGAAGLWLRLRSPPVLTAWQAPLKWQELRTVLQKQGICLDRVLREMLWVVEDGKPHVFLIGFPFPARIGGRDAQMHWQPLMLNAIKDVKGVFPGFRTGGKEARWMEIKAKLTKSSEYIGWMKCENWAPDQLVARGRLPREIALKKVLLIGGGALGSAIAELLLRGGTYDITVIDGDDVGAGNLCRHTLGIPALGKNKAEELAKHLSQASPHAVTDAMNERFPPAKPEAVAKVQACDLIIDCTGEDNVLHALSVFAWNGSKYFVSSSVGYGARRLYCFIANGTAFPFSNFRNRIRPWLETEQREMAGAELPAEGLGCWNPIFPARIDDIWMMAAVAVKHLEAGLKSFPVQTGLTVFEQEFEHGVFMGVGKAEVDPKNWTTR